MWWMWWKRITRRAEPRKLHIHPVTRGSSQREMFEPIVRFLVSVYFGTIKMMMKMKMIPMMWCDRDVSCADDNDHFDEDDDVHGFELLINEHLDKMPIDPKGIFFFSASGCNNCAWKCVSVPACACVCVWVCPCVFPAASISFHLHPYLPVSTC